MTLVPRPRVIREVWQAVFGIDPESGRAISGDQHRVLCPFHFESNASCDVAIGKNTFLCRSCGAKGGILDVVILAGNADDRRGAAAWLEARGLC